MTGKRPFDLALATLLIPVVAPIALGVAVLVRVALGSPVLFRQVRSGKDGLPFVLVKFRTMRAVDGGANTGQTDEARLTRIGRLLRASSLDELPELWNILRGEMSFVGPRPLLPEYLPLYSSVQARRHEVRPGLTGWAQVQGRNAISWPARLAMDVWYVDNRSWALDLRVLALTAVAVIRRAGISAPGAATMPPFQGER